MGQPVMNDNISAGVMSLGFFCNIIYINNNYCLMEICHVNYF